MLLAYNLTGAALPLAVGSRTLPASVASPGRSEGTDVTSELWAALTVDAARGKTGGLSAANFTSLQAQVTAGSVEYVWAGEVAYSTGTLLVGGSTGAAKVVADAAALRAIGAGSRVDGQIVVKLDDYTLWTFAGASAVGANDWTIVPTVGAGRWIRRDASLADLAATSASHGASLIGTQAGTSNVETQLAAKAISADLISVNPAKGAALIGWDGGTTVKAKLDALPSASGIDKRTAIITVANVVALGHVKTGTLPVGAAFPANAHFAGAEINVSALFKNAGDTAAVAADFGTLTGGHTDVFVDGVANNLHTTGLKVAGTNLATFGRDISAEQPTLLVTSDSFFDEPLSAGSLTATVWFFVLP